MLAEKIFGDSGKVQVKIAKSLLNNVPAIRYTIASFDPDRLPNPNPDTLLWGGSSATDIFPGTPATFGGEINGYGQISGAGILSVTEYTLYYIYDGINPIIEYAPNGSVLARYIYAGGMHIAKIAGADTNWYHCDALGSPRAMTNELGTTVTWSGSYYPFGEATTSGTNTHQFTGKELDAEMGLNYFCQRYYDPQIGRFMTLDRWTCLPDDERQFSQTKYLSSDDYLTSYKPQTEVKMQTGLRILKGNTFLLDDAVKSVNQTFFKNEALSGLMNKKYYNHILLLHSTFQLNRYGYCFNNPLRYVDPDGNFGYTIIIIGQLLIELSLGANVTRALYEMYTNLVPGYGYELEFGAGSLWLYMDDEGNYHWSWDWADDLFGQPGEWN